MVNRNTGGSSDNKIDFSQEMKLGASIELAEELELKYKELDRLGMEIQGNLETLKNPAFLNSSPVTWWTYFKGPAPYIALAILVFLAVDVATGFKLVPVVLTIILSVAVYVFAIGMSVLWAKIKNNSVEKEYNYAVKRKNALEEKTGELKERQQELLNELSKYDDLIPKQMRNAASMTRVKKMLGTDEAFSFQEAVRKIAGR